MKKENTSMKGEGGRRQPGNWSALEMNVSHKGLLGVCVMDRKSIPISRKEQNKFEE